jgi:DNA-binding transcriptional ArsR family regulator
MSVEPLATDEDRYELVCPRLAAVIGLNEAIMAQQLHYWTHTMNREGGWIYNTIEAWQRQFPFWSPATIRRTFGSLKGMGIVEIEQRKGSDRTNSYRLVREKIPWDQIERMKRSDRAPHKRKMSSSIGSTERTTEKQPPTPSPSAQRGEQVKDIFDFWQKHHDKPQHQLTDKRRRRVLARLKEECNLSAPYSPERVREIKEAIYGARYSAHHMGTKPDSERPYNDLDTLLRDRGQVDTFRDLFQQNRQKEKGDVDVNARRKEVRRAQGLDS